jgi:hypothetical protein
VALALTLTLTLTLALASYAERSARRSFSARAVLPDPAAIRAGAIHAGQNKPRQAVACRGFGDV